ncbi:MAG: fatty acid oxidation complex subunit alpha FadJ [Chloroflexota bacterium]
MTSAPSTGPVAGAVFCPPPAGSDIGRIVIDRPDDVVNALNPALLDSLLEAVRAARAESGMRGLVVTSAKSGQWVAGADLKLVSGVRTAVELEATSRRLQAICDELAWLPCTTVAAINGAALGGGCELALACDYRVAAADKAVSIGLPEVSLGLIPAGGGTQRLPRLIGLELALDLILTGRRLDAPRARRLGLFDDVVHLRALDIAAEQMARRPKRPLDRPLHLGLTRRAASDAAELTPPGRRFLYQRACAAVLARTGAHYPAPLRALEAIATGFERGMARGLDCEARAFGDLALSATARHLIWVFSASQSQRRSRSEATSDTPIERIGVVGAGFMGAAIAELAAGAGLTVRVRDTGLGRVARGLSRIHQGIEANVRRRRLDQYAARSMAQRVSGTTDYRGFERSDVVIEAVFEDLSVKRAVLAELERVMAPEAVIASNTSALPITDLAAEAQHPERIVGMHFFSPAQRMPLVEIVRGERTSAGALAAVGRLASAMGKTAIVVGDGPGFYTTRVLGVMLNEAALLFEAGASIETVDAAMTAFGFPVGPFVLYDEVGLEIALHVGEKVAGAFGDRIPPTRVVAELVARGATGRTSGAGFYVWPKPRRGPVLLGRMMPRRRRTPNPLLRELSSRSESISAEAIQERLVLAFVNEAIRSLDEGVLASPADGDLGAVLGLGFPPFLGGPFHYVDQRGAASVERALRELVRTQGPRFEPASRLVVHARDSRTFFER